MILLSKNIHMIIAFNLGAFLFYTLTFYFLISERKNKIITSLISTRFLLLYQPLQSIFDFTAGFPCANVVGTTFRKSSICSRRHTDNESTHERRQQQWECEKSSNA